MIQKPDFSWADELDSSRKLAFCPCPALLASLQHHQNCISHQCASCTVLSHCKMLGLGILEGIEEKHDQLGC